MFLNGSNPIPQNVFDEIFENSNGSSAYIEQVIVLLNEFKAFQSDGQTVTYHSTPVEERLPKSLQEILNVRLNYIQKKFPLCFKTLCTAAIMGNKFNIKLLEIVMKLKEEEFQNVMQLLCNFAYIAPLTTIFTSSKTLCYGNLFTKEQSRARNLYC